jgi:DNA-binding transcriptional regulator/RsmH inhibitor MraZ
MTGEVAILGSRDHLQIWNRNNFERKIEEEPLTLEDQNQLSSLGI